MNSLLAWHDEKEVWGFAVKSHFFDAAAAEAQDDFVRRVLPIFKIGRPQLLATEKDHRNYRVPGLVAQPDAVLRHGEGLLAVEYKTSRSRPHNLDRWHIEIPLKAMLQCLAAAIAVAGETGRPTVPLLRCKNALYLLVPQPELLARVLQLIEQAPAYWRLPPPVSASQLAAFCEPWVRAHYADNTEVAEAARAAGRQAHAAMLRS